jgi:hypothetical protein
LRPAGASVSRRIADSKSSLQISNSLRKSSMSHPKKDRHWDAAQIASIALGGFQRQRWRHRGLPPGQSVLRARVPSLLSRVVRRERYAFRHIVSAFAGAFQASQESPFYPQWFVRWITLQQETAQRSGLTGHYPDMEGRYRCYGRSSGLFKSDPQATQPAALHCVGRACSANR